MYAAYIEISLHPAVSEKTIRKANALFCYLDKLLSVMNVSRRDPCANGQRIDCPSCLGVLLLTVLNMSLIIIAVSINSNYFILGKKFISVGCNIKDFNRRFIFNC
jgi:hypothetical protein